MFQVSL